MVVDVPLLKNPTNDDNSTRTSGGQSVVSRTRRVKNGKTKTITVSKTQMSEEEPTWLENVKQRKSKKIKSTRKKRENDIKKKRKEALKKILEKGLTPPKNSEDKQSSIRSALTSKTQSTVKVITMIGVFDNTQWERTRFAYEAAHNGKKPTEEVKLPEVEDVEKKADAPLLGETKQKIVVKGQYLTEKPRFTIILLGIEVLWCAVCILVWSAAADNPLMPLTLAIFNLMIIFLLVLACLNVEYFRLQVRREDTRTDTRYFVPYIWRYTICEIHIARSILLCANITIMVFDDDFDVGSLIVLALTPFHIIIVAIHIFNTFIPKRQ